VLFFPASSATARRRRCARCRSNACLLSLLNPTPAPTPLPPRKPTTTPPPAQSKKRGLSLEDKRDRVLEVFHGSADVLVLKDVERAAAARGVVLQSVKEVLQSLVDDDLVRQERIGAANYFWSFPAEASTAARSDAARAAAEAEAREAEAARAEAALHEAKAARRRGEAGGGGAEAEEAARQAKVARIAELERAAAALRAELAARASSDPRHLAALRTGARCAADACSRWGDNCAALRDWLARRFEGRAGELDAFMAEVGYDEDKMGVPVEP
jgi:hypothetical protein